MKKKYHLKKNIKELFKTIGLVMLLTLLFTTFLVGYTKRIDNINNNKNGYTDNGRNHAVKLYK